MKLQPASEMAKIAEENYEKFKQTILESEEFESLKNSIEEAANEGRKTLLYNVNSSCDPHTIEFLKSVLTEAGYGVNGVFPNLHAMRITW
ncbi:hypothetical protein [Lysinibacillus sp. FSL W8-0953]|uniref:hypothetical protein n=1 Tax=Lysinibacillus sp. FSL W8-0953 TaxID=2954640 RepID=UPI0030F73A5D